MVVSIVVVSWLFGWGCRVSDRMVWLARVGVAHKVAVRAQAKAERMSDERRELVRGALDAGVTVGELSKETGLSRQRIYKIAETKW